MDVDTDAVNDSLVPKVRPTIQLLTNTETFPSLFDILCFKTCGLLRRAGYTKLPYHTNQNLEMTNTACMFKRVFFNQW